jgi:hypothetical protein
MPFIAFITTPKYFSRDHLNPSGAAFPQQHVDGALQPQFFVCLKDQ